MYVVGSSRSVNKIVCHENRKDYLSVGLHAASNKLLAFSSLFSFLSFFLVGKDWRRRVSDPAEVGKSLQLASWNIWGKSASSARMVGCREISTVQELFTMLW